jgi:hypothetical protein
VAIAEAAQAKVRIARLEAECAQLRATLQLKQPEPMEEPPGPTTNQVYFDEQVGALGFEVAWNLPKADPKEEDSRPVVTHVAQDSPANKEGVEPGQVLIAINGAETSGRSRGDLLPLLCSRPLYLCFALDSMSPIMALQDLQETKAGLTTEPEVFETPGSLSSKDVELTLAEGDLTDASPTKMVQEENAPHESVPELAEKTVSSAQAGNEAGSWAGEDFYGDWHDAKGGFFGGSTISISSTCWTPKHLFNDDQQGAVFSWQALSSNELLLLEVRRDGTERRFNATMTPEGTIKVTIEHVTLTWTLTRVNLSYHGIHEQQDEPPATPAPSYVERSGILMLIRRGVRTQAFELICAAVIVVNSIFIGYQANTEMMTSNHPTADHVETAFLIWFAFEAMLRFAVQGAHGLQDKWLIFDCLLVALGFLQVTLMASVVGEALKKTIVLRIARLLRLLRILKVSKSFRVGWKLAHGLFSSFATIWSSGAIIIMFLYVFSLAGIEIISKNPDLQAMGLVDPHFTTLASTMMTLFQFVTMDSIASIYGPLVDECPWLVLYFLPLFLLVSITLLNLVTAVTVDVALQLSREDRDVRISDLRKRRAKLEPIISQWFTSVAKENRDDIEVDDLRGSRATFPTEITDQINLCSMDDLFEVLDTDASGRIDRTEFTEGVLNLGECGIASTETVLLLKIMRTLKGLNTQSATSTL